MYSVDIEEERPTATLRWVVTRVWLSIPWIMSRSPATATERSGRWESTLRLRAVHCAVTLENWAGSLRMRWTLMISAIGCLLKRNLGELEGPSSVGIDLRRARL